MKKTIYQVVVSMAMAFVGAIVCIQLEIGYWAAPIVAFVGCALFGALITGMFDDQEKTKHESIKHRMGGRTYGQAAVFVGTAIVFMGTSNECKELADDLQHYAQDARAAELTGNEVFEIL